MELLFSPDEFARIHDDARRLELHAAAQESRSETLLMTAETDVQTAEAALLQPQEATRACVDALAAVVRAQLQRNIESVAAARQLCAATRESRLVTRRLVAALRGEREESDAPRRLVRHAVLVVDDYEDTRDVVATLLHEAGFAVRTASNGLEAILAAYEMQPAVILMDMTMPVLDGVEATRLIKNIDAIRDARVIAYTALPVAADPLVGRLFAAVLEKPALPDTVVAAVRQCAYA